MKLKIVDKGVVVHTLQLGKSPLTIGRAPGNRLILKNAGVSSHHALVFRDQDIVRFRDLGSTNGVLHNGAPSLEGILQSGDVVQIGELQIHVEQRPCVSHAVLQIEQVDGPVAWTIESGFTLPGHDTTMVYRDGETVWLEQPASTQSLSVGQLFHVNGIPYRLVEAPLMPPTVPTSGCFPYVLKVDLNAERAALTTANLPPLILTSANRVSLLYVLAQSIDCWVEDATIGCGIWGRAWLRQDPNNLNVLLHRIRAQATKQGYDRRFIERKRGAMCLRIASAQSI